VRDLSKEEEEDDKKERLELDQKKYALKFFTFIILGITISGVVVLCLIDVPNICQTDETTNCLNTTTMNTTAYIKAYEQIQIAKMGFFMILLLTLGILGFVGINYLSHPTDWSTKMIEKGRTLEYITVILIIGVILTLGLLDIIGNETIGTILGAIAGYVLGKSVAPKG
jgi:competence protein ComGC